MQLAGGAAGSKQNARGSSLVVNTQRRPVFCVVFETSANTPVSFLVRAAVTRA